MYEEVREIPTVFVKMDKDSVYTVSTTQANVITFTAQCNIERRYLQGNYQRWQLPLVPASATTVHKAQGTTAKSGVVFRPSDNEPFARGSEYVAISRVTEIENLFLLGGLKPSQFKSHHNERQRIINEYERLRSKFD